MQTQRPKSHRTSDLLATLIDQTDGEGDITLHEVLKLLGARAFGLAILIFSLPNSLPIPSPPGFSAVTGLPIVIFSFQMLIGRKSLWLPKRIRKVHFSRAKLAAFLSKGLPYIRKIERLLHPRLSFMESKVGEHLLGLVVLLLATVLTLPLIFGNFLPGLSISVIALGMLERDGLLMLAGVIGGIISIALIFGLYGAFAHTLWETISNFF
jgi:hypothetical protein